MRIAVVGAGAMGSLFGGYLTRAGNDVQLIDYRPERAAQLAEQGLEIEGVGGDFQVKPRVGLSWEGEQAPELVLICVKAHATEEAGAGIAAALGPDSTVLTLQNGVGNVEKLARNLPREQLLAGTTSLGANLLRPGHVHHAGEGETHLGEIPGGLSERAERIAAVLTEARLPATASEDVNQRIWRKLAVNVGINALTALLRVRNGRLLVNEAACRVMAAAVAECVAVANASGIGLDLSETQARVKEVARLTASNRSSMLMDITHGRPTEIDAINGAVARRGRECEVDVSVNDTLTDLVKAAEAIIAR